MDLKKEIEKTQVLILTGGSGKRMGNPELPKALMKVGGKTLIDRCIEFYAKHGFKDFVLLVGFMHEKIEEHVGDGSKYGVKVRYCLDPPIEKVGKGKALKNAILTGAIDLNKRAIIAYPDDVYLDEEIPIKLLKKHLELKESKRIIATLACASGVEYPYGVALAYDGELVEEFFEKPIVQIPSTIGLYVVEPEIFKVIEREVDMNAEKAIEFESVVLSKLAKEKKLGRFLIEPKKWIAINTQKELETADKILSKE
ncbi:MAG: sugar phosphate nucleotidyltransferase [Candidatus Aenigmatarchaeota archaeon]